MLRDGLQINLKKTAALYKTHKKGCYECVACGKKFTKRVAIKRHILIHKVKSNI